MEIKMKKGMTLSLLVVWAILFATTTAFAQKKKSISSYDEVVQIVKAQLDLSSKEGAVKEYATSNQIKGEYIYDITVGDKGKVVTVFAVTSDDEKYKTQNKFKDFLRTQKFDVRTAKGRLYKFQYTFYFE
ncbi:MAG TPA: hypothetical protein PKH65_05140 [Bacteroidia bacterium]|nr:hypothetical protein [Bacteroidia bacterium]HNT80046.1 hypothetical protein [Bacteroidia bacterium]